MENLRLMSSVAIEPALDWPAIWQEFGNEYVERVQPQACPDIGTELLFCLLGGHGVPYELARSATLVLEPLLVFSSEWDTEALELSIRSALERPQFEPRRRDGSLRKYRYPARKAQLIARAATWFAGNAPLYERLATLGDEYRRRDYLCGCPGVGLKTASWMLRNVGLASNLAVVDIHVLRALVDAGRVGVVSLPRDYLAVEKSFLRWCAELSAAPAAIDLLLWEWQRAM
jgi:N-glycosylase/DNA lyase